MSEQRTDGAAPMPAMDGALLTVRNLKKWFPVRKGVLIDRTVDYVKAVDDVSFDVRPGETLGLVGESGSGKSTTGYCVLQLLKPTAGSVRFKGKELTTLPRGELRRLRREMQIVFQDPYSALDPRMTVGDIVAEPLEIHGVGTRRDRRARIRELLDVVGFNPEYENRYPHEFSGGQRQRIGVARALALNPDLIVCDEPVSALDVSIQAQILNLLESLQDDYNLTYLFISHDLGVVRHICDRIAVMYLGHLVELAAADDVYLDPKMPYTASLLSAVPKGHAGDGRVRERIILTGDVPSPVDPPSGCVFHPRCPKAREVAGSPDEVPENCRTEMPPLGEVESAHLAACWYPLKEGEELQRAARA